MTKYQKSILSVAVVAVLLMFAIERFMMPDYITKSICKIVLFGGTILFAEIKNDSSVVVHKNRQKIDRVGLFILFGIGTYIIILIGYFLLSDYIDARSITASLLDKENITAQNFIFVALYISFVNSLLEEAFFRGLLYLKLGRSRNSKAAFVISAFLFSVYHIGIMTNWFSPVMFAVMIAMLFVAGMVLNMFSKWGNSFFASWIIHIAANLSINTIGFIMLLN